MGPMDRWPTWRWLAMRYWPWGVSAWSSGCSGCSVSRGAAPRMAALRSGDTEAARALPVDRASMGAVFLVLVFVVLVALL